MCYVLIHTATGFVARQQALDVGLELAELTRRKLALILFGARSRYTWHYRCLFESALPTEGSAELAHSLVVHRGVLQLLAAADRRPEQAAATRRRQQECADWEARLLRSHVRLRRGGRWWPAFSVRSFPLLLLSAVLQVVG